MKAQLSGSSPRSRRGDRAERGLTQREQRLLALITSWEQAYIAGMRPEGNGERTRRSATRVASLELPFVGRLPSSR